MDKDKTTLIYGIILVIFFIFIFAVVFFSFSHDWRDWTGWYSGVSRSENCTNSGYRYFVTEIWENDATLINDSYYVTWRGHNHESIEYYMNRFYCTNNVRWQHLNELIGNESGVRNMMLIDND